MQLLTELVAIAHTLELWRVDSLLHGELCLKLCCLLECQAENRGEVPPTVDGKLVTFLGYHRSQLLTCRRELESTLAFIKLAQQKEGRRREGRVRGSEQEDSCSSLSLLHVECVYDLTRVQVKLASTIPPSGKGGVYLHPLPSWASFLLLPLLLPSHFPFSLPSPPLPSPPLPSPPLPSPPLPSPPLPSPPLPSPPLPSPPLPSPPLPSPSLIPPPPPPPVSSPTNFFRFLRVTGQTTLIS